MVTTTTTLLLLQVPCGPTQLQPLKRDEQQLHQSKRCVSPFMKETISEDSIISFSFTPGGRDDPAQAHLTLPGVPPPLESGCVSRRPVPVDCDPLTACS